MEAARPGRPLFRCSSFYSWFLCRRQFSRRQFICCNRALRRLPISYSNSSRFLFFGRGLFFLFRAFRLRSQKSAAVFVPVWRCSSPVFLPDRKSTRLNSSHRCISYAVFCLKKKI